MIIDKQTQLSNAQALTATADSENIYDAGVQGDHIGAHSWVAISAPTALNSASHTASIVITMLTADDTGFSVNLNTLWTSQAHVVGASGLSGFIDRFQIPIGLRRYTKLVYTVGVENCNAGTISAAIVSDPENQLNF